MTTTKYPASLVNGINDLLTGALCGQVTGVVVAADYTVCSRAPKPFTVAALNYKTSAGTATLTVKLNGVAITGLSALAASSVAANATATALNSIVAGDRLTLTVASPSADCANIEWTLSFTEPTA